MPSRATVYRWAETNDSFRDKFARGRNAQAHFYFEKMIEIAFDAEGDFFVEGEKLVSDHVRVARARLQVDTLKFAASKLLPRTYGDKPAEESAGALVIAPSAARSFARTAATVELLHKAAGRTLFDSLTYS